MPIPQLYLASQSPRRQALLQSVGLDPIVLPVDPEGDPEALEAVRPNESPRRYVRRVATLKRDTALRGLYARPHMP